MDLDPIFFGGFQNLEKSPVFYFILCLLPNFNLLKKKGGSEFCTVSFSVIHWNRSADPYPDPDLYQNGMDPEHWL
jgi:hypothetical protein